MRQSWYNAEPFAPTCGPLQPRTDVAPGRRGAKHIFDLTPRQRCMARQAVEIRKPPVVDFPPSITPVCRFAASRLEDSHPVSQVRNLNSIRQTHFFVFRDQADRGGILHLPKRFWSLSLEHRVAGGILSAADASPAANHSAAATTSAVPASSAAFHDPVVPAASAFRSAAPA
jgi:hypothetical protein